MNQNILLQIVFDVSQFSLVCIILILFFVFTVVIMLRIFLEFVLGISFLKLVFAILKFVVLDAFEDFPAGIFNFSLAIHYVTEGDTLGSPTCI